MGYFQVHSYFYNIMLIFQYAVEKFFHKLCGRNISIYNVPARPQCGLPTSVAGIMQVVSKNTVQVLYVQTTLGMNGIFEIFLKKQDSELSEI